MKILTLDDNIAELKLLTDEVKKCLPDAVIDSFSEAGAALETFKDKAYDIVFLNVRLPVINGIAVAEKINSIRPQTNIIYVTTHKEYGYEAFGVHASGYIAKPVTAEAISEELKNLRYSSNEMKKNIVARTFGQFDILVDGMPVHFNRTKSKELMAYLIDRRGGGVTKKELAAVIFEDSLYTKNIQDYMGKLIQDLDNTLKNAGISDIFIKKRNYYAVDTDKFECDLYDYIDNREETKIKFYGEYMNQYSWAEATLGSLYFD